jgi:hypothetical protein
VRVRSRIVFDANGIGQRAIRLVKNGTVVQYGPRVNGTAATLLSADVSETEVVNTNVKTAVFIATVPGGTIGTQGGLEYELIADMENQSGGSRSPVVTVEYGGQTVFTGALGSIADGTNRSAWNMRVKLWAFGSASVQVAGLNSWVGQGDDADGGGITQNETNRSGFNHSLTVDTSVDQTFTVSVTPDFSHADFSVRVLASRLNTLAPGVIAAISIVEGTFSVPCSEGDLLSIEAYQNAGAALNIGSTDRASACECEIEFP